MARKDFDAASEAQAKEVCLRLLTARNYTTAELATKLAARGFEPDASERAIVRLSEVGLIDDQSYSQMYARTRHSRDRRGRRTIALELKRKGISESLVTEAVSQVSDDAERHVAGELVRKTLRGHVDSDPAARAKQMRRAVGVLARRGFDPGMSFEVVRAEFSAAENSAAEL